MGIDKNPLLNNEDLPLFNYIRTEHISPALDYILTSNRKKIEELTASEIQPDWDSFMDPLDELSDQLERMWAPVSYLNAVMDSAELRRAYETCLLILTEYVSEVAQNQLLFKAMLTIQNSAEFQSFDLARKKALENSIRDFRLSGVSLDQADRARYRDICIRLSELENTYSQNLLDATDAWQLHIVDDKQLVGLPPIVLSEAESKAQSERKDGWVFTLHSSSYTPFMTYADNRALREEMYKAYCTRASELGPGRGRWNNADIMCEILVLRNEMARLTGFDCFADYALESRMVNSTWEVADFLNDLAQCSGPIAEQELEELTEFACRSLNYEQLAAWDMKWASEKLKQSQFDFTDEELRPYFPLDRVMSGMFLLVQRLFGITIREKAVTRRWHVCVQLFEIYDRDGELRGHFFTDLYAREHKHGGAWMTEFQGKIRTRSINRRPVACLTCNFAPPVEGQPSLLKHEEVITLFHEFGHSLHCLLTRVEVPGVAGINGVPWDAVELPSQFLENWCWDKQMLYLISGHYETGEPIPETLMDKILRARNFQSAMSMLRQVEFSLFDLEIHRTGESINSIEVVRKLLADIRKNLSVVEVPPFNRFENSFEHIFAGGYEAGYYSYKWAEVLSADAFSLFEENGIFDKETGEAFLRKILEKGGAGDPLDLFTDFRGRKPTVDALLRHLGLSRI